jgi:formylglycine-generating enzyme required for sulfatase activity
MPALLQSRTDLLPALRTIPAGECVIGESDDDKFALDTERPAHLVRIARPFRMGAFPVTVGEFRRYASSVPREELNELPVVNIDWQEAAGYCAWLASETGEPVRLPSEAEWEYACRAGTRTPFHTGSDITPAEANFLYDETGHRIGLGRRTPPGMYAPNAYGLESMHGNVCEWCADVWSPDYSYAPDDGSAFTGEGRGSLRVIRGGAWDYLPRLLRSSWRDALPETSRRDNVGFRIVIS